MYILMQLFYQLGVQQPLVAKEMQVSCRSSSGEASKGQGGATDQRRTDRRLQRGKWRSVAVGVVGVGMDDVGCVHGYWLVGCYVVCYVFFFGILVLIERRAEDFCVEVCEFGSSSFFWCLIELEDGP